uniref:Uncharacterized protein n=1 Tax=Anguilla anguilla TaxID=7936 RepID=A0A0E9UBJ8_ANGAN
MYANSAHFAPEHKLPTQTDNICP